MSLSKFADAYIDVPSSGDEVEVLSPQKPSTSISHGRELVQDRAPARDAHLKTSASTGGQPDDKIDTARSSHTRAQADKSVEDVDEGVDAKELQDVPTAFTLAQEEGQEKGAPSSSGIERDSASDEEDASQTEDGSSDGRSEGSSSDSQSEDGTSDSHSVGGGSASDGEEEEEEEEGGPGREGVADIEMDTAAAADDDDEGDDDDGDEGGSEVVDGFEGWTGGEDSESEDVDDASMDVEEEMGSGKQQEEEGEGEGEAAVKDQGNEDEEGDSEGFQDWGPEESGEDAEDDGMQYDEEGEEDEDEGEQDDEEAGELEQQADEAMADMPDLVPPHSADAGIAANGRTGEVQGSGGSGADRPTAVFTGSSASVPLQAEGSSAAGHLPTRAPAPATPRGTQYFGVSRVVDKRTGRVKYDVTLTVRPLQRLWTMDSAHLAVFKRIERAALAADLARIALFGLNLLDPAWQRKKMYTLNLPSDPRVDEALQEVGKEDPYPVITGYGEGMKWAKAALQGLLAEDKQDKYIETALSAEYSSIAPVGATFRVGAPTETAGQESKAPAAELVLTAKTTHTERGTYRNGYQVKISSGKSGFYQGMDRHSPSEAERALHIATAVVLGKDKCASSADKSHPLIRLVDAAAPAVRAHGHFTHSTLFAYIRAAEYFTRLYDQGSSSSAGTGSQHALSEQQQLLLDALLSGPLDASGVERLQELMIQASGTVHTGFGTASPAELVVKAKTTHLKDGRYRNGYKVKISSRKSGFYQGMDRHSLSEAERALYIATTVVWGKDKCGRSADKSHPLIRLVDAAAPAVRAHGHFTHSTLFTYIRGAEYFARSYDQGSSSSAGSGSVDVLNEQQQLLLDALLSGPLDASGIERLQALITPAAGTVITGEVMKRDKAAAGAVRSTRAEPGPLLPMTAGGSQGKFGALMYSTTPYKGSWWCTHYRWEGNALRKAYSGTRFEQKQHADTAVQAVAIALLGKCGLDSVPQPSTHPVVTSALQLAQAQRSGPAEHGFDVVAAYIRGAEQVVRQFEIRAGAGGAGAEASELQTLNAKESELLSAVFSGPIDPARVPTILTLSALERSQKDRAAKPAAELVVKAKTTHLKDGRYRNGYQVKISSGMSESYSGVTRSSLSEAERARCIATTVVWGKDKCDSADTSHPLIRLVDAAAPAVRAHGELTYSTLFAYIRAAEYFARLYDEGSSLSAGTGAEPVLNEKQQLLLDALLSGPLDSSGIERLKQLMTPPSGTVRAATAEHGPLWPQTVRAAGAEPSPLLPDKAGATQGRIGALMYTTTPYKDSWWRTYYRWEGDKVRQPYMYPGTMFEQKELADTAVQAIAIALFGTCGLDSVPQRSAHPVVTSALQLAPAQRSGPAKHGFDVVAAYIRGVEQLVKQCAARAGAGGSGEEAASELQTLNVKELELLSAVFSGPIDPARVPTILRLSAIEGTKKKKLAATGHVPHLVMKVLADPTTAVPAPSVRRLQSEPALEGALRSLHYKTVKMSHTDTWRSYYRWSGSTASGEQYFRKYAGSFFDTVELVKLVINVVGLALFGSAVLSGQDCSHPLLTTLLSCTPQEREGPTDDYARTAAYIRGAEHTVKKYLACCEARDAGTASTDDSAHAKDYRALLDAVFRGPMSQETADAFLELTDDGSGKRSSLLVASRSNDVLTTGSSVAIASRRHVGWPESGPRGAAGGVSNRTPKSSSKRSSYNFVRALGSGFCVKLRDLCSLLGGPTHICGDHWDREADAALSADVCRLVFRGKAGQSRVRAGGAGKTDVLNMPDDPLVQMALSLAPSSTDTRAMRKAALQKYMREVEMIVDEYLDSREEDGEGGGDDGVPATLAQRLRQVISQVNAAAVAARAGPVPASVSPVDAAEAPIKEASSLGKRGRGEYDQENKGEGKQQEEEDEEGEHVPRRLGSFLVASHPTTTAQDWTIPRGTFPASMGPAWTRYNGVQLRPHSWCDQAIQEAGIRVPRFAQYINRQASVQLWNDAGCEF